MATEEPVKSMTVTLVVDVYECHPCRKSALGAVLSTVGELSGASHYNKCPTCGAYPVIRLDTPAKPGHGVDQGFDALRSCAWCRTCAHNDGRSVQHVPCSDCFHLLASDDPQDHFVERKDAAAKLVRQSKTEEAES